MISRTPRAPARAFPEILYILFTCVVAVPTQRDELTLRLNTAVKGEEDARKELDVLCQKFEGKKLL